MVPAAFVSYVARILERYSRQNALTPVEEARARRMGERLVTLIGERGLPRSLRADEMGEPGEMSPEEVAPLVNRVLGDDGVAGLENAVRQLVKACFHPEFKKCRDSYREVDATGICRRQLLAKVRSRVSGAHCVDCPYWTGLTPAQHEALLASAWVGERSDFEKHREIFLPEDYRAFRQMVRAWAAESP